MASGSAEDRWRVGRWRHGDLDGDGEPPEEGEVDAGCHSETDTEDYYNRHSPSPIESGETVGDCDFETTSSSAVVPANGGGGDASTSSVAPGCSGPAAMAAVSPNAKLDQPMAPVVAAEDTVALQPTPLAFATPEQSLPLPSMPMAMASARTNLSGQSGSAPPPPHGDPMEIAAAGAANPPPTEAAAVHHQPIASPPPVAPAAAGRQNPRGYTCKRCGMWFRNHQGLGGHMVGHKNRELAAAAAAGAMLLPAGGAAAVLTAAGRRHPSRPERPHVCDECGAEFRSGVQLGGHKRKHWAGPPIVPKKKKPRAVVDHPLLPPPAEAVADLALALSVRAAGEAPPAPPVAVEAARPAVERTPQPAPRPPATGRVLLFGIDIGSGVQAPEAQQGSPPATESSASTGGQQ